jgi:hypothetical protein
LRTDRVGIGAETRAVRKNAASAKTVLTQQQRTTLQAKFARQKCVPLDIRPQTGKAGKVASPRTKFLGPVKFSTKS